jgi:hypothetical protein
VTEFARILKGESVVVQKRNPYGINQYTKTKSSAGPAGKALADAFGGGAQVRHLGGNKYQVSTSSDGLKKDAAIHKTHRVTVTQTTGEHYEGQGDTYTHLVTVTPKGKKRAALGLQHEL